METIGAPIVIGGGVAGIAGAVRLAKAGAKPILIESRPYLGGRVRSFIDTETGDQIDNGQHLLMGCYHRTFELLEVLGTRRLVTLQSTLRVEFRDPDGAAFTLHSPSFLPSPLNVAVGMLRFNRLSFAERLGLLRVGADVMLRKPHSEETVEAYLYRLGQSGTAREWLWDPIILATLNTHPAQASATIFAQVMRLAFLGTGHDSSLAIPRAGLSELLAPATDYIISRGGRVITGCMVSRVERQEKRGGNQQQNIYRLTLRNGEVLESPTILSALPYRSFRTLFAPLLPELPAIAHSIEQSPILSLYLWFDRTLLEIPEFCGMIGTRVQWVFNRRKIVPESNNHFPGLLCCVISAADQEAGENTSSADNRQTIQFVEKELRRAFPSLAGTKLLRSIAINEKQATFACSPQTEHLRPVPGAIDPGLFVAGDWTATGLPGTIEGGVRSGLIGAEKILAR